MGGREKRWGGGRGCELWDPCGDSEGREGEGGATCGGTDGLAFAGGGTAGEELGFLALKGADGVLKDATKTTIFKRLKSGLLGWSYCKTS